MKNTQNSLDNPDICDKIRKGCSPQTDEQLCALAAEGNASAAETLVMRYNSLVRSCSRTLFLMGGEHEDLIQEGMLGLTLAIQSYRPDRGASFRTYAERCIRNRLVSAVRTASSGRHEALNSALSLDSGEQISDSLFVDPEAHMISLNDLQERLMRFQATLSPLESQVLALFLCGVSYQEISKRLNRSSKSIDNAVQRIRKKLHPTS